MNHDEIVRRVLSQFHATGYLKSRESNTIEFKESFNKNSTTKYAKTMAAFWYCQIKFATLDSVYHVTLPVH